MAALGPTILSTSGTCSEKHEGATRAHPDKLINKGSSRAICSELNREKVNCITSLILSGFVAVLAYFGTCTLSHNLFIAFYLFSVSSSGCFYLVCIRVCIYIFSVECALIRVCNAKAALLLSPIFVSSLVLQSPTSEPSCRK